MPATCRTLLAAAAVACAALCVAPAGCARQAESEGAAQARPEFTYTVRGRIVALPDPDRPFQELEIRHEQIPDFKNREGKVFQSADGVLGMKAMTMPFPVGEGVDLSALAVGDIVEFEFVTIWGPDYPEYRVTSMKPLPEDTELDFTNHATSPTQTPGG